MASRRKSGVALRVNYHRPRIEDGDTYALGEIFPSAPPLEEALSAFTCPKPALEGVTVRFDVVDNPLGARTDGAGGWTVGNDLGLTSRSCEVVDKEGAVDDATTVDISSIVLFRSLFPCLSWKVESPICTFVVSATGFVLSV